MKKFKVEGTRVDINSVDMVRVNSAQVNAQRVKSDDRPRFMFRSNDEGLVMVLGHEVTRISHF